MVDRIKLLCNKNNISLAALQKEFEFGKNSISRWDKSSPYLYGLTDNPKANKINIDISQLKHMSEDELRELALRALEEIEWRKG